MGLTTLEDRRLRKGDRVKAHIGSSAYTARILSADDPAKLLVELENGRTVWVGRRAILDLVNGD